MAVYNEAGEVIKIIFVKQFPQPITDITLKGSNVITSLSGPTGHIDIYYQGALIGTWDGTNALGNPAPNGIYNIKVDNVDTLGSVTSTTQQAMVNRALYQTVILVYNEAGEVVRHLYSYVDDPGLSTISSMTLSSSTIQPTNGGSGGSSPAQVMISLSNGTTVMWDGKADGGNILENGQYFITVHANDGKGGESNITQQVTLINSNASAGLGKSYSQPNILTSASEPATFVNNSNVSLTLTATLYTLAGERVAVFTGTPGTNQAPWSSTGLASGLYVVVVELRDAAGGLAGRQLTKVVIRR